MKAQPEEEELTDLCTSVEIRRRRHFLRVALLGLGGRGLGLELLMLT